MKPFAHALFGSTFSGGGVNSTGFTTYLGGGLDVEILPFVSARLAQVDWMGAKKAAKFSKRAKVPKSAAKGRSRSGDDDTRRNSCAKCATRSTIGPDGLSPGTTSALAVAIDIKKETHHDGR